MQNPCTIFSRTNKGFNPSSFRDGKRGKYESGRWMWLFLSLPSFGEVFPERGGGGKASSWHLNSIRGRWGSPEVPSPLRDKSHEEKHEPVCPEDIQLLQREQKAKRMHDESVLVHGVFCDFCCFFFSTNLNQRDDLCSRINTKERDWRYFGLLKWPL